jgi:methylated-DNA-[protein]-cysteine S-methyltransferase
MTETGFALFDTAIGCCGVVWGEHGIVGVQFPEGDERQTRNRLQRRFSAAR